MTNDGPTTRRRTLADWFALYGRTHTHPMNKALHKVCVPVIFVSLLALLDAVPLWRVGAGEGAVRVSLAWPVVAFGIVFYARLSWAAGLLIGAVSVAVVVLAGRASDAFGAASTATMGLAFVVAWIGQFIGHKVEGAKPAFLDDLLFLFIGPLWVARELLPRSARGA